MKSPFGAVSLIILGRPTSLPRWAWGEAQFFRNFMMWDWELTNAGGLVSGVQFFLLGAVGDAEWPLGLGPLGWGRWAGAALVLVPAVDGSVRSPPGARRCFGLSASWRHQAGRNG
eukprot:CAMPEP_0204377328 /NCGR_PEP_ID=MMETSP0469-20131031/50847_1 /ASSEMBLY_ACC=CAM_ASM_000384 /TAXON_ID=2969 /ORGANISM="Oxyrrhis marina" /LENGTH=114 /DNA_ID=CAMNT_0051368375 /DNA_START=20 /DNA_END=361 /DNA_ORIENTATION=-